MIANRIKQTFLAILASVLVATVFLGIKSGVAQNPAVDPPGGGISPTFSDIKVTGDIDLGGNFVNSNEGFDGGRPLEFNDQVNINGPLSVRGSAMEVSGEIRNPGSGKLKLYDQDGIDVYGPITNGSTYGLGKIVVTDIEGLNIYGPVSNSSTNQGGRVTVQDAEGLDLQGPIVNSSTNGAGKVVIQDDVDISGVTNLTAVVVARNAFLGSTETSRIEVQGVIRNPATDNVTIDDNLSGQRFYMDARDGSSRIKHAIDLQGNIYNSSTDDIYDGGNVVVNDNLSVNDNLRVDDNLTVARVLSVTGNVIANANLNVAGVISGKIDFSRQSRDFAQTLVGYYSQAVTCPTTHPVALACNVAPRYAHQAELFQGLGTTISGNQCFAKFYQSASSAVHVDLLCGK